MTNFLTFWLRSQTVVSPIRDRISSTPENVHLPSRNPRAADTQFAEKSIPPNYLMYHSTQPRRGALFHELPHELVRRCSGKGRNGMHFGTRCAQYSNVTERSGRWDPVQLPSRNIEHPQWRLPAVTEGKSKSTSQVRAPPLRADCDK